MVSRSAESVVVETYSTPSETRPTVSIERKSCSSQSRPSSCSRLVTFREGIRKKDFSAKQPHTSLDLSEKIQGLFTMQSGQPSGVLDGKLIVFKSLFNDQPISQFILLKLNILVSSTIKGYISAIGRTIASSLGSF